MLTCEICGKKCRTPQGMSGHLRFAHGKPSKVLVELRTIEELRTEVVRLSGVVKESKRFTEELRKRLEAEERRGIGAEQRAREAEKQLKEERLARQVLEEELRALRLELQRLRPAEIIHE